MKSFETDNGDERDLDTLFEILSPEVRRKLLRYIDGQPVGVPVARLATALGGGESVTRAQAHAARAQLYHVHLPRLEAAGLVTWDRDTQMVAPTVAWDRTIEDTPVTVGGVTVTVTGPDRQDSAKP